MPPLQFASQRSSPQSNEPSSHASSDEHERPQGPLAHDVTIALQACFPVHTTSHGNSAGHCTLAESHAESPLQTTRHARPGAQARVASLQASLLEHSMVQTPASHLVQPAGHTDCTDVSRKPQARHVPVPEQRPLEQSASTVQRSPSAHGTHSGGAGSPPPLPPGDPALPEPAVAAPAAALGAMTTKSSSTSNGQPVAPSASAATKPDRALDPAIRTSPGGARP